MSIKSIADKIACAGASGANTGKLGCLSLFGTPAHLLAFNKGLKIPAITEFDLAYLTPEIQANKMIPIIDASAFEDLSAEDGFSTNTSTVKRLNVKGLPEYKLMFEEGHEFYKELAKLESFKSYDFAIGDDMGNWMLVENSDGSFGGFSAGHVTPTLTKRKVKGGDSESKSLVVQFLDRMQWDQGYKILHRSELTFSPSDIPSVNGAYLAFDTLPAALATTLKVSVMLSSDHNTPVEGLVAVDFIYTVDGISSAIADATETSPGKYDLTVPSTAVAEELTLDLYDDVLKTHIIDSAGVLFRSDVLTATVIA